MPNHHYESVYTTTGEVSSLRDVSSRWKVAAACFGALQLLGYMMLAIVIGYPPQELQLNTAVSTYCAFFLIGGSCCGLVWIACVQRKHKRFINHALLIPYATFNTLALINILLHILAHDLHLNTLRLVGICLPTAFSVCYTIVALLIYRDYHREAESSRPLLSDEELQRLQLLRLLKKQSSSAPSADLVRNTYRFDLPDDDDGETRNPGNGTH